MSEFYITDYYDNTSMKIRMSDVAQHQMEVIRSEAGRKLYYNYLVSEQVNLKGTGTNYYSGGNTPYSRALIKEFHNMIDVNNWHHTDYESVEPIWKIDWSNWTPPTSLQEIVDDIRLSLGLRPSALVSRSIDPEYNVRFVDEIKVVNNNNDILQNSMDLEKVMVQNNIGLGSEILALKSFNNDVTLTNLNKLVTENAGIDSQVDLSPHNNNVEYLTNLIMESETSIVDDVTYDKTATQKINASVGTLSGVDKRFVLLACILFFVLIMPSKKVK